MTSALALLFRSPWSAVIFLFFAFIWSVRGGPVCKATCNGTNEYWSGVEANGTRLVLAPGGRPPPPAQDDVLMIIQMQGGTINNSDDLNYGAGNGTGSGFTDVGLAGQYEFAEVASVTHPPWKRLSGRKGLPWWTQSSLQYSSQRSFSFCYSPLS